MPRPEKVQAVEQIREQLDEARATFVTEYRGLTVGEQQELRRSVHKAQGEYQVFKMSLARRAVEGMSLEGLPELLVGPTALAFANTDPVPVAKVLRDFASSHEKLIIKGGILGGALLPPEQISRLADIEPRDVLLSKIAGGFKAPLSKLAGMFGAKMRDAASMFSQLLEKKEEEAPEVAEVPVAAAEPVTEEVVAEVPVAAAEPVTEEVAEEVVAEVPVAAAEPVTEEAPSAEAESSPESEAPKKPAQKKKAAPKAKADKSSAKAEAEAAPADGSDDTAEEE